ncbi:MAG: hypothetical protein H6612_01245 [Ignavibacteriales bacterium]|nr:hypothetical protein [Ignavibacteriales bacterium]
MKKYNKILIVLFLLTLKLIAQSEYNTEIISKGYYYENRNIKVNVFRDNDLLYSVDKILTPHFSIPESIVLNNGNLVLIHSLEGIVEIFNTDSKQIFQKAFYKLPPHREQSILFDKNKNGFALLISEEQINNLYIVSDAGNFQDSIKVKDGLISGISISDGDFISYSIFNWDELKLITNTTFVNLIDKSELSFPVKFNKGKYNLSQNLFLGYTNKNYFCIDLNEKNVLWQNNLDEKEIFVDTEFNEDKIVILKSINPSYENKNWIYKNYTVVEKDYLGNEVKKENFNDDSKILELVKTAPGISIKTDKDLYKIK